MTARIGQSSPRRVVSAEPRLVERQGKTALHRFRVALVAGDNRLQARGATADGALESEPASLTIPFSGKLPQPELYVLAVGVNRHAKDAGVPNLDFCVPDANAI